MSAAAERVLTEGLQLPPEDRWRIAQELWNSLPEGAERDLSEAEFWEEIKRRNAELDEGKVQPLSHEEIMSSARETLRCLSAITPGSASK